MIAKPMRITYPSFFFLPTPTRGTPSSPILKSHIVDACVVLLSYTNVAVCDLAGLVVIIVTYAVPRAVYFAHVGIVVHALPAYHVVAWCHRVVAH